MSHSDIRVVPGPANYFSHPGSLARLQDFYSEEQLSRAVWVYGERAIAGAQAFCRQRLTLPEPKKSSLKATVAKAMSASWPARPATIGRW